MKLHRILAYFFGPVNFAAAFFIYYFLRMKGFPDGHLTELDIAEKKLFPLFMWATIFLGFVFFYLGWTGLQNRIDKKLCLSLVLSVIFIFSVIFIHYYFSLHLENGAGG